MNQKSEIGKLGEDLACEYLVNNGFIIIERNFRKPWGELDIIVKQNNGTLVFVEVKTIRQSSWQAMRKYGLAMRDLAQRDNYSATDSAIRQDEQVAGILPEDNLTSAKLNKLKRTASLYAGSHPELVDDEKGWQIDLLAITLDGKNCDIKHFENIS